MLKSLLCFLRLVFITLLRTSWILVLLCSWGVSQDFEWILYFGTLGFPPCGTVYLGISCLNLQPVYMAWIFISVFQYNNILSAWTVSLEFIQTKEQLVKNWILNTEFHPLRAFSFYPWCCLVLSDSWFFFFQT